MCLNTLAYHRKYVSFIGIDPDFEENHSKYVIRSG